MFYWFVFDVEPWNLQMILRNACDHFHQPSCSISNPRRQNANRASHWLKLPCQAVLQKALLSAATVEGPNFTEAQPSTPTIGTATAASLIIAAVIFGCRFSFTSAWNFSGSLRPGYSWSGMGKSRNGQILSQSRPSSNLMRHRRSAGIVALTFLMLFSECKLLN